MAVHAYHLESRSYPASGRSMTSKSQLHHSEKNPRTTVCSLHHRFVQKAESIFGGSEIVSHHPRTLTQGD